MEVLSAFREIIRTFKEWKCCEWIAAKYISPPEVIIELYPIRNFLKLFQP